MTRPAQQPELRVVIQRSDGIGRIARGREGYRCREVRGSRLRAWPLGPWTAERDGLPRSRGGLNRRPRDGRVAGG